MRTLQSPQPCPSGHICSSGFPSGSGGRIAVCGGSEIYSPRHVVDEKCKTGTKDSMINLQVENRSCHQDEYGMD
ncbi:hypothetical protein MHYP_G00194720 [Metynnis hypsauchen]